MSFKNHTLSENNHKPHKNALKLTVIYAVSGSLWIFFSDLLFKFALRQHTTLITFQTISGLIFILITSVLIYGLFLKSHKNIKHEFTGNRIDYVENLLKKLFSSLGDVILLIEPTNRTIQECNEAVKKVFGYSKEELRGKNTAVLHVNNEFYRNFGHISEPILEQYGIFRTRYQMKTKDGETIETENTVVTLREEDGWQGGVVSIVRDITNQVRFEEALKASEEKHRLLAENTLDVIWSMNFDLEFTYVNPAIVKLTGHTPDEFIGSSLAEHCTPETLVEFKKVIARELAKGRTGIGTIIQEELLRKDGSVVPVEVHGRILFAENEEPLGIQGTARDISERRELEAKFRQAQKMEGIGTLASGVAHEINNPINGILNYADIIKLRADDPDFIRDIASRIINEGERITGIVKNLLGFARIDTEGSASFQSISEIIDSTLCLIQSTIRHNHIILETFIDEELPDIFCHRQQIQQVILNLLTNACDALNERYSGAHDNKKIIIKVHAPSVSGQESIRMTVEDHGTGIPRELHERIFEPFYTSKLEGQGTGLGLWITYEIVKNHGGEISTETERGAFTRFHIDLPTKKTVLMPSKLQDTADMPS